MVNLEEMTKLWELAYLQESTQLCVIIIHYYSCVIYTDPHRGPLRHKFIFGTHLEGPQTRLLSLLQDYMWRLLSAYKTKPVINMIIKRNLKNKCIISIPAVWIRLCRTRALCLLPEIRTCTHTIWDCGG